MAHQGPTYRSVLDKYEKLKADHADKPETLAKALKIMTTFSRSSCSVNLVDKYLDVLDTNARN